MSGISTHETTHDTIHDPALTQKQALLLDFRNAKRKIGGRRGEERRSSLRFFFLTVNLPDVPESWIIAAEQGFTKGVDCNDVI
jgi:hypothetical protein